MIAYDDTSEDLSAPLGIIWGVYCGNSVDGSALSERKGYPSTWLKPQLLWFSAQDSGQIQMLRVHEISSQDQQWHLLFAFASTISAAWPADLRTYCTLKNQRRGKGCDAGILFALLSIKNLDVSCKYCKLNKMEQYCIMLSLRVASSFRSWASHDNHDASMYKFQWMVQVGNGYPFPDLWPNALSNNLSPLFKQNTW